jgi:hypothetical protein
VSLWRYLHDLFTGKDRIRSGRVQEIVIDVDIQIEVQDFLGRPLIEMERLTREELITYCQLLQEQITTLKMAYREQVRHGITFVPKNKKICDTCGALVPKNYPCKKCNEQFYDDLIKKKNLARYWRSQHRNPQNGDTLIPMEKSA